MSLPPPPTSPPLWLPPLNAHDYYTMTVAAYEVDSDHIMNTSKSISEAFSKENQGVRLYIDTDFKFYPSEITPVERGAFKGLSIKRKNVFRYYSHFTSSVYSKETIVTLLKDMLRSISFEYDRVVFIEKSLDRDEFSVHVSIRGFGDLMGRFLEFLKYVKEKPYNKDKIVFNVMLKIAKDVEIPREEYKAWINWYDEKKQADPSFEDNYKTAISRPRRVEEIIYHTTPTFQLATGSWIERVLEDFWNDEKERTCSICLGGILIGSKCSRLPCKHAFHERCITRWLSQSRVCHVCRFSV